MHFLKKNTWTIGKKIFFLSSILLFNMLAVGGVGLLNSKQLMAQLNEITNTHLPAVKNMTLVDMMHDGLRAVAFHAIIASEKNNREEMKMIQDEFEEFSANLKKYLNNINNLNTTLQTKKSIQSARPKIDQYIKVTENIISLAIKGKSEEAKMSLPHFQELFKILEADLEKLGELIEADVISGQKYSEKLSQRTELISAFVIFFGLLMGFCISMIITKDLLNQLIQMAQNLKIESSEVAHTATNINSASQNLAQSTTQQASAVQETAASIEEINAMIKKGSENANKSKEVATASHEIASKGKLSVEQMVLAIQDIDFSNKKIVEQVDRSNTKLSEIVKVISEIGDRTKVINEIVFQTKLLSFNASVEAARAGEHGKGFSVVAEEVGNLAKMSGNAAKEISDMLKTSVIKVENIVNESKAQIEILIEEGKTKVENGSQIAKECGEILNKIVQNAAEVNTLITEISTASDEQAQGIGEITKAMNQMDQTTHANASASQQTASSSEQLFKQSASLLKVVNLLENIIYQQKSKIQIEHKAGKTKPEQTITNSSSPPDSDQFNVAA